MPYSATTSSGERPRPRTRSRAAPREDTGRGRLGDRGAGVHADPRRTKRSGRRCSLLVTENGIATDDDTRRIDDITGAIEGMKSAVADGVDVPACFCWSLLDNYE